MQAKSSQTLEKNKEKAQKQRDQKAVKLEERVMRMDESEVLAWLKQRTLPTFGTRQERVERVRKALGLPLRAEPSRDRLLTEIDRIKQKREDRRAEMLQLRREKQEKELYNESKGVRGDIDFEGMIEAARAEQPAPTAHLSLGAMRLSVCVRKRPIFARELAAGENDCLAVSNPEVRVFDCKLRVDGITKYIDTQSFRFDNTFSESEESEAIFEVMVRPAMEDLFAEGVLTLCAYGQTGSGKTHTMLALQRLAVAELYRLLAQYWPDSRVSLSFFEIYGGRCFDLLNEKARVQVLEDRNNSVVIQNLAEKAVSNAAELLAEIARAFEQRTTHATVANDSSSRSHAVCQIIVRRENGIGRLVLVDLAGSERAQDTTSNDQQRRLEGAEINKSLLALKECIRAMDQHVGHVPFRVSKLTLTLRDSFTSRSPRNRVVMIACVCPCSSSADHTLNTLRYADRLKSGKALANDATVGRGRAANASPAPRLANASPAPRLANASPTPRQANASPTPRLANASPAPRLANASPAPRSRTALRFGTPGTPETRTLHDRDMRLMRQTLREEFVEDVDNVLTLQGKVDDIIEMHEELMALHLTAIKEDAQLLSRESELIADAQHQTIVQDLDEYVGELGELVDRKLALYRQLQEKLLSFRSALCEEEEMSTNLKRPHIP